MAANIEENERSFPRKQNGANYEIILLEVFRIHPEIENLLKTI